MNEHKTLSQDLLWRGLIKDRTFTNDTWLDTPQTFYLGADCNSADSLTIGNLAIFLVARRLMESGWKAVLLVGGATSLIGDPGGKDAERDLKTREEIQANVAGIKKQVQTLFAGHEFTLVDNYDWFKDIGYLEFLRDVGKHYSMTELIQREYIAARLGDGGNGISYAEFSYSLIQGYDFWHLYKNHDVQLQIGGSDQWGNMLSGVPLIRKKESAEVHALSMPLVINKITGKKFGKSEDGAVWLDPTKTTPTQFYQFWINCDDEGVEDYLKVYTFMSQDEITDTLTSHRENPSDRLAQKKLAEEVTALVHGDEALDIAVKLTAVLTGVDSVANLGEAEMEVLRQEIPSTLVERSSSVIQTLVTTGLCASNTEARRLLNSNAIALNGTKLTTDELPVELFENNRALLRRGRAYKDSALVELA